MDRPVTPAHADNCDDHWERFALSAERNPAQEFRRREIVCSLGVLPPPARLLDIGCGQGDLLRDLRERYPKASLVGIDRSDSGLDVARHKVPTARFVRADLLDQACLPEELVGWASAATCSEVLEHVDDPVTLLSNARRALALGCKLVVTVPGGPRSAYDRHIGHRRHFDRRLLRDVLTKAGYRPVMIRRAGFPAFNIYKLLVIMRGKRVIADAQSFDASKQRLGHYVMSACQPLFKVSSRDSPFGWQLVAIARYLGD